jgi:UDP-N-acetylmuramoylalanine--D-glutamate ligase
LRIAIAGFGIEGKSSLAYFKNLGHDVVVVDENTQLELPMDAEKVLGENAFKDLGSFDLVVRSSGLKPSKLLENNPGLESKITTQLNEFLKVCPSKNIIGVTGTKGKGTTSTLIANMLEASGKSVKLGGNIGVAMLSMLEDISPETYVVLELSSFQLSDLVEAAPHTAVCLMIAEEHLDWHGDLDSYIAAKANLFSHQSEEDIAIFYADNDLSKRIAEQSPGSKVPYFAPPGAYVKDGQVMIEDQVICETSELKLLGRHNWQNVCAAVTAVWQYDKNIETIRQVLINFSGLTHRLEFIREVEGIKYYNDSYASQLKATEAATMAIPEPKVLIVGGFDRMLDLASFSNFLSDNQGSIRKLLLIGASAHRLSEALGNAGFNNFVLASDLKSMSDIVGRAKELAEPGDAVVLSPGFASFDMFKNFEDRGNQFKEIVNSL